MRRSVLVVLLAGVVAICLAVVAVLSHKPLVAIGDNAVSGANYIELEEKVRLSNCQPATGLPDGTSAIRIWIEGIYYSPPVVLQVLEGSHVLSEAHHRGGGPPAPNVIVPVSGLSRAPGHARVCTAVDPTLGPVRYDGVPSHLAGRPANALQQALLRMEYLHPGPNSWWSYISAVARHMGLGPAPGGTWVAFLVLALMLAVGAAVVRTLLEELR